VSFPDRRLGMAIPSLQVAGVEVTRTAETMAR
jgi:hypothetical protein